MFPPIFTTVSVALFFIFHDFFNFNLLTLVNFTSWQPPLSPFLLSPPPVHTPPSSLPIWKGEGRGGMATAEWGGYRAWGGYRGVE